jgi:hypothetical protein
LVELKQREEKVDKIVEELFKSGNSESSQKLSFINFAEPKPQYRDFTLKVGKF